MNDVWSRAVIGLACIACDEPGEARRDRAVVSSPHAAGAAQATDSDVITAPVSGAAGAARVGIALADNVTALAPTDAATKIAPARPDDVSLVLTATCAAGSKQASGLAITLSVPIGGHPSFQIDDTIMGTPNTASLITDAVAQDGRGELPLVRRLRAGVLELVPARAVIGRVTLRYRVRSTPTNIDGPREGLRHDATGIGGHGRHFLILPSSRRRYRMRIEWASAQCPAPTRGAGSSTFGEQVAELTGELAQLREGAYFFGTPQRARVDDGALHVRALWFGEPQLDVQVATEYAARVFAAERAFFVDDDSHVYSLFVRVLAAQTDRANGIGHESSFLSAIGPRTTFARRLKINIAHEMLHRWLGLRLRLRDAEGSAYWFTEGFTVHYSNVLAFRAGLLSIDEFLDTINDIATRHFDNPRAGASNDEIRRRFYQDPALAIVPYTRGALYAAELDAALRRTATNKRSLDDVMRELYAAFRAKSRARGASADDDPRANALAADAVRKLVVRELGRRGAQRYDAVIVRGGAPQPAADAYGPCFTQVPRKPTGFLWVRVPGTADDSCQKW